MSLSDYEEKKKELNYLYNKRILNSSPNPREFRADINAFFTTCYHLKDFIKTDSECIEQLAKHSHDINKYVEDFVTSKECLCFCGALATRSKHSENTSYSKRRGDAKLGKMFLKTTFTPPITMAPHQTVNVVAQPDEAYYFFDHDP